MERVQNHEKKVRADIAEFGWHVVLVLEDEEGPPFAYSIGLQHSFGHPEIIMFGLRHESMHGIINWIGEMIKGGKRFCADSEYGDLLEGYQAAFMAVPEDSYEEYFGQAINFYGGKGFKALQVFWPDRAGRFPWAPDFEPNLRQRQPQLAVDHQSRSGAE